MSWFRVNRWGLVGLIPALTAILYFYWGPAYEKYWEFEPREPQSTIAGAQINVLEFGPADDLKGNDGKAFEMPPSMKVWRAVLSFNSPGPKTLGGCNLWLEDSAGRVYSEGAAELRAARTDTPNCYDSDKESNTYQTTVYFATAADARPVAVRVTLATQFPKFARLPVSSGV